MEPWYKVTTPRREVREGRSFNPDEFAIHLEQVIAGTAPEDYRNPEHFFRRTCLTRALREHAGLVLRRLSGQTANTAPVMTLVTQFGGGKTHTLTALYHLVTAGAKATAYAGVCELLRSAGISAVPEARVAAFVGNAWDPRDGRKTPWIEMAWQLAGEQGVSELGAAAEETPPGTEALQRVFRAANGPVLLLFDEVLNFVNRHRNMADKFHAFIQNLTVATTGTTHCAAVISLPRSQVEMTEWDMQWQEKITKVVRRVAKDLIANDETEISEVIRRRLFEEIGSDRMRKAVSRAYADWCFERRAQLPAEWTAVDSTATEAKARELLRSRFEACYPFHPATLSVFQRKWQALQQYQQTRGTLAMLAQWISWAYRTGFTDARREPLITLGSAPLEVPDFRGVVLGQLGEARLAAAIETDIAGTQSHARALDADTSGALRNIHRRTATAILFESSGGQIDKVAHLPELRFALGEPQIDTTSVDNAAFALADKSYFIRRIGTDGFRISHQPTLKKVVSDRRASLDEETDIKPAMRKVVEEEFRRGATVPVVLFPEDSTEVLDTPRLTLVVMDPSCEWPVEPDLAEKLAEWTRQRGKSPRLYPGSLVWCVKREGRDLRESVEMWLAWKRVAREIADGTLGAEIERADRDEVQSKARASEAGCKEEVWGGYRYAIIADSKAPNGLTVIDLGAGHSSSGESLCGRVLSALKSQELLNESVGAGYIERNWPPAFRESGAWPLQSLRQSFLNGSLTRLMDPDSTLTARIVEFVSKGDFGLAYGRNPDGSYDRVWYGEPISRDEVAFESDVYLLTRQLARALKEGPPPPEPSPSPGAVTDPSPIRDTESPPVPTPVPAQEASVRRISGPVPPEVWNRLGTKLLPKLRQYEDLKLCIEIVVKVDSNSARTFDSDIRQILEDLGLTSNVRLE